MLVGDLTDLERYGYLNPAAYASFPFEQEINWDGIIGLIVFGVAVTICVVGVVGTIIKNLNLKCPCRKKVQEEKKPEVVDIENPQ